MYMYNKLQSSMIPMELFVNRECLLYTVALAITKLSIFLDILLLLGKICSDVLFKLNTLS